MGLRQQQCVVHRAVAVSGSASCHAPCSKQCPSSICRLANDTFMPSLSASVQIDGIHLCDDNIMAALLSLMEVPGSRLGIIFSVWWHETCAVSSCDTGAAPVGRPAAPGELAS